MFALEGAVEFPHTQGVCTCLYVICLCVPKSAVPGVAPHSGLFVYNYVYVCYVLFVPSQLLLESLHTCVYVPE